MSVRVVFFGNSDGVFSNRHFVALLETRCEIVGVVDVPPSKRVSTNASKVEGTTFVRSAREQGIPAFEPARPNASEFVAAIRALSPDLLIAVGYMNRLRPHILAVPRLLAANFHASLLPAYRGLHPLFWALRNGERSVGLSVHAMGPELDTGDILYQVRVRTRRSDTVSSAYERVMVKSLKLVGRLIDDAASGTVPRPATARGPSSSYSSVREEDLRLDWSRDAEQLRRWVTVSPGKCFCVIAGRMVWLLDAEAVALPGPETPGTVVAAGRTSVTIAAGAGAVRMRSLRIGSGDERPARAVFDELGLKEGYRL